MALLVAGLGSLATPRTGLRRIWAALRLWFEAAKEREQPTVAERVYRLRLDTCRSCPLWFGALKTCGSPLKKELRGLGCYCYMPAKARLTVAQCWLDEQADDPSPYGWNHALGKALNDDASRT